MLRCPTNMVVMLVTTWNFFLTFDGKRSKDAEKVDFNQLTVCRIAVYWSKYKIQTCLSFFFFSLLKLTSFLPPSMVFKVALQPYALYNMRTDLIYLITKDHNFDFAEAGIEPRAIEWLSSTLPSELYNLTFSFFQYFFFLSFFCFYPLFFLLKFEFTAKNRPENIAVLEYWRNLLFGEIYRQSPIFSLVTKNIF